MSDSTGLISTGLLDLQVNGYGGIDFNAGHFAPGAIDQALEAMLRAGVTTCLPTIITAYPDELEQRLRALDAAITASVLGPLMCPGYHLEGPFLNPAPGFAGCHPAAAMTGADATLITRLEAGLARPALLVTVAPEIAGGMDLIRTLHGQGKLVSIGHSAVTFEQVSEAVAAGARLSTHLGNGLAQNMHKLDNPIFAQLAEDGLAASFIADGIHIHPKALKSLLRAKGIARSILVTDAVTGAAAAPGRYSFAGMAIERRDDGSVRTVDGGGLAGAALCLDQAVRNLVSWGYATPEEALAMASSHPRRLLAPVLQAHGLSVPHGEVQWSKDMVVRQVRIGAVERHYGAVETAG